MSTNHSHNFSKLDRGGVDMQTDDSRVSSGEAIANCLGTLILLGGFILLTVFIWSLALNGDVKSWLIGGAIAGVVIGGFNGLVVANQGTHARANDMKAGSSMFFIPLSIIASVIGGLVWLVRSVL